ncbi:MAG: hypothetical protein ACRCZK_04470, partial [Oscillospiraceae bacterium]
NCLYNNENGVFRAYMLVNCNNMLSIANCLTLSKDNKSPILLEGLCELKKGDKIKFMMVSDDNNISLSSYCACGQEPYIPSVNLNMFKI